MTTKLEYLRQRCQQFGVEMVQIRQEDEFDTYSEASEYWQKVKRMTSSLISEVEKIRRKDIELGREIHQLQKNMPALRAQASEATALINAKRNETELAGCLQRFESMGVTLDDPLFHLKFTFQHHLDLIKPYIHEVYDRDIDVDKVVTDPNYMDELIIEDPKAVYVRGLLFMVAESAYEQETQADVILGYMMNHPHLNKQEVAWMLMHQAETENNTYFHFRAKKYVKLLNRLKSNNACIDERTHGHHLHYFLLPCTSFEKNFIKVYGSNKDGNIFTDDEVEAYLSSLESWPMLKADFGYKQLLRITEPFVRYQEKANKVKFYPLNGLPDNFDSVYMSTFDDEEHLMPTL